MPEPDEELTRLRSADPIEPTSLPSATDPAAVALFERIVMNDPTSTTTSITRRRPLMLAVAAVALLVLVGAALVVRGGSDGDVEEVATATTTSEPGGPPLTPGGASSGSCVEFYDLQTLKNREVAFDGTVASRAGDQITFTVNRWFRGGDGDEITLSGGETLGGVTSAGPGAPIETGTRLLVAGDGGFAWACGFTQPFDAAVAEQWASALDSR